MAHDEAEELLTAGLSGCSRGLIDDVLTTTGRWPILPALVNGAVRAEQEVGCSAKDSLAEILDQLRTAGPTVLDIANPEQRSTAVNATMQVSMARLTADQRSRYTELAVFGEEVIVPGAQLLPSLPADDKPYVALDAVHLARWRGHALAR